MNDSAENLMIWNSVTNQWECPICGHNVFYQVVLAENSISIKTHDKLIVEANDFSESWSIVERKTIHCASCNKRIGLPLTEDVWER